MVGPVGGVVVGESVGPVVGPPVPPELTGEGSPEVKSAALSSVSLRAESRDTEAVLLAPAAAPPPSWTVAVP